MPKSIDLTGQKFGRLTVLERAKDERPRSWWLCRCECGNEIITSSAHLKQGTKSCGCLQRDAVRTALTKHGHAPTKYQNASPEYRSWRAMKLRCNNPNHIAYKSYGGRGIKICERWNDFTNFLADMGARPEGAELNRVDNDKNYEPGNVIWSTDSENNRNRRNNLIVEFNGQKKCLAEWAETTGIAWHTLYYRIFKLGWSLDEAMAKRGAVVIKEPQQKLGLEVTT